MLDIKNIGYKLGNYSINYINMHIGPGEYFILVGENGVGKTSLLEMIAGRFIPNHGSIYIDGRDVSLIPPENREISLVPQTFDLFKVLTVEENIMFSMGRKKHDVNMKKKRDYLMDALGISNLRHKKTLYLSGGEKQKCALARALMPDSKLLLLDEPLSALDSNSRQMVIRLLSEIKHMTNTTIIHVTHDIKHVVELGDRVGILKKDGSVITYDMEMFIREKDII